MLFSQADRKRMWISCWKPLQPNRAKFSHCQRSLSLAFSFCQYAVISSDSCPPKKNEAGNRQYNGKYGKCTFPVNNMPS